jgi:hypothetical protein
MIALKRYFLAAVFAGACCSVCRAQTQGKSETIVADFERAVRTVQEQPKWPSGTMYSDMEGAANDFVRKHSGSSALDVLQDKIKGNRKPRKLALLVLAKLAVADEAAEEVFLHGAIYGKNRLVAQEAVIAVAYLDPADGRGIAEKLMTEPGPWEVRKAAVEMLVGLGDEHTL